MVGSAVLAMAVSSVAIATDSRIADSASTCCRPARPSATGRARAADSEVIGRIVFEDEGVLALHHRHDAAACSRAIDAALPGSRDAAAPRMSNDPGRASTTQESAMAATEVFAMQNNFTQGTRVGICSCIALNWARRVLKKGGAINKYSEIGLSDLAMNAQMAQLRKLDADPAGQCELVDLEPGGGDQGIASADDVIRIAKKTAPH